jgi:allophanate hydrolase
LSSVRRAACYFAAEFAGDTFIASYVCRIIILPGFQRGGSFLQTVAELVAAHRQGVADAEETIGRCFARIRAHGDPGVFITLREEAEARAEARALKEKDASRLPLFGVPFAVKDNIDVQGLPTTVACPDFAYRPTEDATAVARLRAAGAIVIGKTNLDQFATGLVGTRTPYPVPRNALKADYVPGGSSSGSAVAVAAGLVPFALGTDTAGSGRVPAMFNNIVGLKPSLGLVSTRGVFPACRTLDCVSVFSLTVDDASSVLAAMAGFDEKDAYSRNIPLSPLGAMPPHPRLGVPVPGDRLFFGDKAAAADYDAALARLGRLGATIVEIDIEPFYETARLLYEGPWLAERYFATRALLASDPEAMHDVTRDIILGGARPSAADAFAAFYQLEDLRRVAARTFADIDALVLPTAPTIYTVEEVRGDPIRLNSRLGTYTNFVNLLDLCGLAVPAALRGDNTPFGITLLAPSGRDAALAALGRVFHADTQLPLGALRLPQPPLMALPNVAGQGEVALAVVGAHLSGLPLNGELRALRARYLETVVTAPCYRLFALAGAQPAKPGLLRTEAGGAAIEAEIWALPVAAFGAFVAAVPPPLSIGTLALADGRSVKGFLVEAEATRGAEDITRFGGWRSYLAQTKVSP